MFLSLAMRSFRSPRFVRVMALFAWLMLVAVPLPTSAMGSIASMSHGGMPASMVSMMEHGKPQTQSSMRHHAQDCCGDPAHAGCHCDAMCGSVLLPALPVLSGTHRLAGRYATLYGIDAPALDPIPPLRPPAV
jgi:hypothetical protein